MDDNDIEFAVKLFKKNKDITYDEFLHEIRDHKHRRPAPKNSYDPFSFDSQISKLWRILVMDMRELIAYSKLDMAKFSRRYCIPYRTLQAWCDGTNDCPIYIKLLIGESLKMYSRVVYVDMNGWH